MSWVLWRPVSFVGDRDTAWRRQVVHLTSSDSLSPLPRKRTRGGKEALRPWLWEGEAPGISVSGALNQRSHQACSPLGASTTDTALCQVWEGQRDPHTDP